MTSPTLTHKPAATPQAMPRPDTMFYLALGVPLLVVTWAYWPNLCEMAHAWSHNAQYSHGYLVPTFAAVLLWLRRDRLRLDAVSPSWWGAVFLAVGVGMRAGGSYYHLVWIDSVSLLPCLAGLCLLIGGWTAWRWAWPSILFLFFMVKLPFSVEKYMSAPLQLLGTECSTYLLQTLGVPALSEGTIIRINDAKIGVVEACSGLKMLIVFFALSTGMVLVIKAPLGDKLVVVASSVPIALVANILRITITGLLHDLVGSETANAFFHDVAGWLMMPVALGMMWLELKTLDRLLIPTTHTSVRPPAQGRNRPTAPPAPRPRQSRTPYVRSARTSAATSTSPRTGEPTALSQQSPEQVVPPNPISPQGATA